MSRTLAERGLFDEGDTHGQEAIRIAATATYREMDMAFWLAQAELRELGQNVVS